MSVGKKNVKIRTAGVGSHRASTIPVRNIAVVQDAKGIVTNCGRKNVTAEKSKIPPGVKN